MMVLMQACVWIDGGRISSKIGLNSSRYTGRFFWCIVEVDLLLDVLKRYILSFAVTHSFPCVSLPSCNKAQAYRKVGQYLDTKMVSSIDILGMQHIIPNIALALSG